MVAAGVLAKKAVAKGLKTQPWVKTSLAPGSQVVTDYLTTGGLIEDLNKLRFNVVGYGCTTCIGNSGRCRKRCRSKSREGGAGCFGRAVGEPQLRRPRHPEVRANYLASRRWSSLTHSPDAVDIRLGQGVTRQRQQRQRTSSSKTSWPTHEEVQEVIAKSIKQESFKRIYGSRVRRRRHAGSAASADRRVVLVGRRLNVHRQPAVLPRNGHRAAGHPGDYWAGCAGASGRQHHHRPHFTAPATSRRIRPPGSTCSSHGVEQKDFNQYEPAADTTK